MTARRTFMPPGQKMLITGFAASPDGELYMSCQMRLAADLKMEYVNFYRWNDTTSQWDETYSRRSGGREGYHAIFGVQKDQMLVSTRLPRFEWLELKR